MRLIFTILLFVATQASATNRYISNTGSSDLYGGSISFPWATAAKINSVSLNPGDSVLFERGGIYLGFVPVNQSGNSTNNIYYGAYGTGPNPIITGLVSLTTWTNIGTNLWKAVLNAGPVERMVTVGNVLTPPGRFPNTGWLTIGTGGSSSLTTVTSSPSTYNGANILIKKREWINDKCPITSISGSTINFANVNEFPAQADWGFFFTDHLAACDLQNEWVYKTDTLKMYSTTNPSGLSVKASKYDSLLYLSGKNYIKFENLVFEGSNSHLLMIYSSTGVTFSKCTIQRAGKNGLDANFLTDFLMDSCTIYDTNYSGVDAIIGSNQRFTNNQFGFNALNLALCGPGNKANHGLWVNGVNDLIANNEVGYVGYVGIDMSGNYDTIRNNYVHHYAMIATDGGGIYMSDETNGVGRVIRDNIVVNGIGERSGTPYTGNDNAMAYYLDESTAGVELINNFGAYCAGGGLYNHKGHDLIITGNTFFGNTFRQVQFAEDGPLDTKIKNVVFKNNVLHSLTSSDYLYVMYGVNNIDTFFRQINYNTLSRPSSSSNIIQKVINYGSPTTYSLATWRSTQPSYDPLSTGTPSDFATGTPVTYFNSGRMALAVPLDGVYKGLRPTVYNIGTAILQPSGYEVLIRTADIPTYTTQTTKLNGRFR